MVDMVLNCLLAGHQQLINEVCYSPDARLIASASFDKSVKLWDGKTGRWALTRMEACGVSTYNCTSFLQIYCHSQGTC